MISPGGDLLLAPGNCGNVPLGSTFSSWYYWGHGRVGPYFVVWFDFLAIDGIENTSSYVSHDGKILNAACESIKVRPFGANSTYSLTPTTGSPSGCDIELLVGY
ncbi:hypothetical protein MKX08_002858 [Trichoderma sp. CBMAI-0020]|nr:hypothetical protein MKX08_002858 [Trichoderma sp. CBMAI-0020]WOD45532.1 hypothetical protein [Trichoderma atroviride]